MPHALLRSRCLAAAAVVTASGLAATACSGGGDQAHKGPRYVVPSGTQPVGGVTGAGLGGEKADPTSAVLPAGQEAQPAHGHRRRRLVEHHAVHASPEAPDGG